MIEPADDVRQRAAKMRADKFELRQVVEDARHDEPCECDGIVEHVSERTGHLVTLHELGRERLRGMQQHGQAQFRRACKNGTELRLVRVTSGEIGVEEEALHPKLIHATVEFLE